MKAREKIGWYLFGIITGGFILYVLTIETLENPRLWMAWSVVLVFVFLTYPGDYSDIKWLKRFLKK